MGILQHRPWKWCVSLFFLSPVKFKLSETQKSFKKAEFNIFITAVRYCNYHSKWNLVLHVKHFRSKFTDGKQRLQRFTKRRSVLSLKEMMPYNKELTNLPCLERYWGVLALGRFCTDFAAFGLYCHDLQPIFPQYCPCARLARG